jgi:hypothetical protein
MVCGGGIGLIRMSTITVRRGRWQRVIIRCVRLTGVELVHLVVIPVAVALKRVQDGLRVRRDQVGPRLPQRMNDKVNETDLERERKGKY